MLSMHSAHIAITDFHSHRATNKQIIILLAKNISKWNHKKKEATKLVPNTEQNERKNCFGIYSLRNSFSFSQHNWNENQTKEIRQMFGIDDFSTYTYTQYTSYSAFQVRKIYFII